MAATGVSISQIQGVLAANNLILPAGSLPNQRRWHDRLDPRLGAAPARSCDRNDLLALAVGVKMPAAGSRCDRARRRSPWAISERSSVWPTYPTGYAELNKDPQHGDAGPALVISVTKTTRRQHRQRRPGGQ